mmetsp:Transcript_36517/g.41989  ORF Transcript_36517/g.41989 Transcript_36517/m.41989 type:complete len:251 (+) Transcript_36517:110-862(+)
MSSPYQNQTVVVHNNVNVNNNNVNEDRTVVKTQHKKKKKNIRYTGTTLLFLTIVVAVAVTVMISARKVPPTLFGSVTNTNVRTSTSTAIMSSEDDEDDDETWYDADEEKEAGQHDDSDSDTDSNTSDRFDPHEYPSVQQFTPKKEAHGYGNTVTVTKKNTKKKCPACYFPTSTLVGNVCQQLCHDTQQEQTQAVRKGRGWNFLGTNKVQDNWCAGTYLSTNEVQVGKDNFRMACTFKTGSDTGGSIFDKS